MITNDIHLHTSFSSDNDTPMEDMIRAAIDRGLTRVCFTEHMDHDYPSDPSREKSGHPEFWLDTDAYRRKFLELKDRYEGKLDKIGRAHV